MFNSRSKAKQNLTGTSITDQFCQNLRAFIIRVLSSFVDFDFKGSTETFLSKLRAERCSMAYEFSLRETILMVELCIEKEGVEADTLFTSLSDLMELPWPVPTLILNYGNI